jgi:hypothetical protein
MERFALWKVPTTPGFAARLQQLIQASSTRATPVRTADLIQARFERTERESARIPLRQTGLLARLGEAAADRLEPLHRDRR